MKEYTCEACGQKLIPVPGKRIVECSYCLTVQTLPSLDDRRLESAGRYLKKCDFDRALRTYENLVPEFRQTADIYWGIVLARYGIEYVTDKDGQRIPTCHRSSYDSILEDPDYLRALQYAELDVQKYYQTEAGKFEQLRKDIIAISVKEDPYDIFICFKDTDDTTKKRTPDSAIAERIYEALENQGYRVFFSRRTLENRAGEEYEPIIFAALHSAEVMLVVGTDYENFNATWVKNEWGRYLKLIAAGEKKHLITCFKDINAREDLPSELYDVEGIDMDQFGWETTLLTNIRGFVVPKRTPKDKPKTLNATAETKLKRAFLFLEEENWKQARGYAEDVLEEDSINADAYLVLLCAEMQCKEPSLLAECTEYFGSRSSYEKALRYGDETRKAQLENYRKRNKTVSEAFAYNCDLDWKAQTALKDTERTVKEYENLLREFRSYKNWNNAGIYISRAEQELQKIRKEQLVNSSANAVTTAVGITPILIGLAVVLAIVGLVVKSRIIDPINRKKEDELAVLRGDYQRAMNYLDDGEYMKAYLQLHETRGYEDTDTLLKSDERLIQGREDYLAQYTMTGNRILLGRYDQNGVANYQEEDVEWIVLDYDPEKKEALLISAQNLYAGRFCEDNAYSGWEKSDVRKWMNEDFLKAAFTAEENSFLVKADVKTSSDIAGYTVKDTQDKVFALSREEIEQYVLEDGSVLMAEGTKTVFNLLDEATSGNHGGLYGDPSSWWTRSPAEADGKLSCLYANGFYESLIPYNRADMLVGYRPAIRINLEALAELYK